MKLVNKLFNLPDYQLSTAQWLVRLAVLIPLVASLVFWVVVIGSEIFTKNVFYIAIPAIAVTGGIALIRGVNSFINQWSSQANLYKL